MKQLLQIKLEYTSGLISLLLLLNDTSPTATMAPLNQGSAFYHRLGGIYLRKLDGDLVTVEGTYAEEIKQDWCHIRNQVSNIAGVRSFDLKNSDTSVVFKDITLSRHQEDNPASQSQLRTCEVIDKSHGLIRGLACYREPDDSLDDESDLSFWAELFLLLAANIQPFRSIEGNESSETARIAGKIADIFDQKLRHNTQNDQWEAKGRSYFIDRVYGFVDKRIPLELCLPAFPCKSPNPNKVSGLDPDEAESYALRTIQTFLNEIRSIYEPGAELIIISDGHVFSDCSEYQLPSRYRTQQN